MKVVLPGVFPPPEAQRVLIPAGFSPSQRTPGQCCFHMTHLSDAVNSGGPSTYPHCCAHNAHRLHSSFNTAIRTTRSRSVLILLKPAATEFVQYLALHCLSGQIRLLRRGIRSQQTGVFTAIPSQMMLLQGLKTPLSNCISISPKQQAAGLTLPPWKQLTSFNGQMTVKSSY